MDTNKKARELASEIMDVINDRFTRHPRNPEKSLEEKIASILEEALDEMVPFNS